MSYRAKVNAVQRRLGIGGHQSASAVTVEWLTPPYILKALGPFDLDPCAPVHRPWAMAAHHYTTVEDGLAMSWFGRVWLNPPYAMDTWKWLERLSLHDNGLALIFARTETDGFHKHGWGRATGMRFFRGRLHFHHLTGERARGNCGGPSVLIAYGEDNAHRLQFCDLPGHFVRLTA